MSKDIDHSFQYILEQNKQQIVRICSAYGTDADEKKDLFQEVAINIWKSLPTFEGRSSITTWIYRITLNTCMRARLKLNKYQTQHIKLNGLHFNTLEYEDNEEHKEKQMLIDRLHKCIGYLKNTEKNIALLYLEDLPYKEIAAITGITQNHVAVHMKRIKEKLLTCLNK